MRIKLLSLPVLLAAVILIIYVACRKTDHVPVNEPEKANPIEERFFDSHRTGDHIEKALVDFIKKENNKEHFVEKTVKQIGYPQWNKLLSFKKSCTPSASRENFEDSASIYYIPFVRDTQNFVNASLVIKAQQGDTTFFYVCDWQYQNKMYGSPAVDSSAERHALFFMLLDNQVFGYNEFNLTDTNLFPAAMPRPGGGKKLGFINITNQVTARASLMEYHELCVDFYVCGDPDWCADHGGCDYLNCASESGQPGHCYVVSSICTGWWEETGGAGGGTGGTEGGGSGGGSGSGSGSTPPECDEVGPFTGRTYRVDPCTGGWDPIPIEDEPGTPLPAYVINSLTKPCLQAALTKLSGGTTNTFFKQVYNTFDTSTVMHLLINEADLTSNTAYGLAYAPIPIASGVGFVITLDTVGLLNCSHEWMAYVMIHEVAHAAMFANVIQWDTTNSQHAAMMSQYLTQMATSLMAAYPGLTLYDAYAMCYAGFNNSIDGIITEPALLYLLLKQVKTKLNDFSITAQQLISRGEEYTETGIRGLRTGCN